MTEASHLLGHINGVYNDKDKSNHVCVLRGSGGREAKASFIR